MTENNLIAEFMGLEYFPDSKCSIENWGSHDHFEPEEVWIKNPTPLYKEIKIHYGYGYNADTNKYEGEISKEQLFEDYFYKLRYHSSWDWLIPVVEKIEKLDFVVQIHLNSCFIKQQEHFINGKPIWVAKQHSENKIESVYNAVLTFIKWYNEK